MQSDVTTLGNLLLAYELVDPDQLRAAIREQKAHPERRLGEILVAQGATTHTAIRECLDRQTSLRDGAPCPTTLFRLLDWVTKSTNETNAQIDAAALALKPR